VSMAKKMVSPYNECCIGQFPGLCTRCFKTSTRYLKFMLYHIVIWICLGYFRFFPFLCPNCALVDLNVLYTKNNRKTCFCTFTLWLFNKWVHLLFGFKLGSTLPPHSFRRGYIQPCFWLCARGCQCKANFINTDEQLQKLKVPYFSD